jgi:hypothetical protein
MSLRRVPFGFTPLSITGCQLWLDGADSRTVTLSSSAITQWNDKSTSGNHFVQATTANSPTVGTSANGLPTIYFATANQQLVSSQNNATSGNASRTVIQVFWCPTLSSTYASVTGTESSGNPPTAWGHAKNANADVTYPFLYSSAGADVYTFVNSTPNPLITYADYDSTASSLTSYYATSGATNGTTTVGSFTTKSLTLNTTAGVWYLGRRQQAATGSITSHLFEMIQYNKVLTTTERQQVESYLVQKWGLSGFLSVGHPGLTTTIFRPDYIKNSTIIRNTARPIPYFTTFSPRQIPGLGLWLDAADSSTVTGTTPITGWTDKSGNGRTVTITSGPTYGTTSQGGNRTMVFNNNTITTSIASAVGTGDFTLIAVWYQSSAGTNTVLSLGTVASSSQSLGFSGNKYNFYQFGDVNESAYSASSPSWAVQIGTRIGSVKKVYINGNVGTTPSSTSYDVSVTTVTIGKGDNFAITGEIGEIMVYTGTMSDTSRQSLESYLAQKWGLTASLPGGHLHFTQRAGAITTVANTRFRMVGLTRAIVATGGTITTSGGFRIHSFTSVGTTNFVLTSPSSITAQVLVVAGGGAGGYDDGGGGGAGGVIYNAAFTITSGTYGVVVGNGGTSNGANGGNSVLSSLTAVGGGGGATSNGNGQNGGSGGGIGWGAGNGATPGSGTAVQGFAGGGGTSAPNYCAGGGGGAGGVGGTGSGITPGNGGIGVSHTIAGTTYNVGGGGGGGLAFQNSSGTNSTASFGGGNGAGSGTNAAVAGTPNTGGGGGGANNTQAINGASGGSGIVIIAYSV